MQCLVNRCLIVDKGETLILFDALQVLSKSSKYSVSTLRTECIVGEFETLKDYLYIPTEIHDDLQKSLDLALLKSNPKSIICLCGSSGDGKSEILTKLYGDYSDRVDFHLDATHSDSQHKSAIECLNEKFDNFKESSKPFVIGINIGMLQKFIKQGDNRHSDIKNSFSTYFDNRHSKGYVNGAVTFFDFECYPRLSFSKGKITSGFISDFLKKLTNKSPRNPFYGSYLLDSKLGGYVSKNFDVLSLQSFQNKLIELFGLARLIDEQFLIPRIFVDFIFQILTRENKDGIVGNVFSEIDNEFSSCFRKLDPINIRNNELDNFYLEYTSNTLSKDIIQDIDNFNQLTGRELTPEGLIRCSFLLRELGLSFPSPNCFESEIITKSLNYYLKLINVYEKPEINSADEDDCLNIIEGVIIKAAIAYANRMLSINVDGHIVSRKLKDKFVCNKLNVQADLDWIEMHELKSTDTLPIPLIINNQPLLIINIDLNTLIQAVKISDGYRPNRQNIENTAKFDEIIRILVESTLETESMKVVNKDKVLHINKNRNRYTLEILK